MNDLYPWQKVLLEKLASWDATSNGAIFMHGRQIGRSAMLKAMNEARIEFIALYERGDMPVLTGTSNVKPKPYYRRDRNGKPARW